MYMGKRRFVRSGWQMSKLITLLLGLVATLVSLVGYILPFQNPYIFNDAPSIYHAMYFLAIVKTFRPIYVVEQRWAPRAAENDRMIAELGSLGFSCVEW